MSVYSQDNEEAVILEHFSNLGKAGVLLDIGAADGERFSNSRALMEMGWEGFLVEPCARSFAKLVELYLDNPKALLWNLAVTPEYRGCVMPMQYAMDTVVSTFNSSVFMAWKDSGRYRTVHVPTVPVWELFSQGWGEKFDFITIDAEGWSFEIAEKLLHHCKPSLWCIENDDGFHHFELKMNKAGYKHFKTTQSNSLWRIG